MRLFISVDKKTFMELRVLELTNLKNLVKMTSSFYSMICSTTTVTLVMHMLLLIHKADHNTHLRNFYLFSPLGMK